MLSQKILQGLFRALDLAEEVRAVVDRMRGKAPPASPWETVPPAPPPSTGAPPAAGPANTDSESREGAPGWQAFVRDATPAAATARKKPAARKSAPKASKPARAPRAAAPARRKKEPAAPAADAPAPNGDLQSILDAVGRGEHPALTDALEVDGRNMLGRIVWALAGAEKVLGHGISGPDVAALAGMAGKVTAPNNVMRAIRQDGGRLFQKGAGSGRALVLALTDEGREQARKLGL